MSTPQVKDAKDRIEAMLEPGETLRWVGRPVQGVIFRGRSDVYQTILALLLGGFGALFPIVLSMLPDVPRHLWLCTIAILFFWAVSLLDMLILRYWWDARYRRTVVYGLSRQRAFIATPRKVRTYALNKRPLSVERRTDRWLTLKFGEDRGGHRWRGPAMSTSNFWGRFLFAPRFDALPIEPIASVIKLGSGTLSETPQDP